MTYLLSDCLGGSSKVLMFAQISPSLSDGAESLCTLQFASRARNVSLGPAKQKRSRTQGALALAKLAKVEAALSEVQARADRLQLELRTSREEAAAKLADRVADIQARAEAKYRALELEHAAKDKEILALKLQRSSSVISAPPSSSSSSSSFTSTATAATMQPQSSPLFLSRSLLPFGSPPQAAGVNLLLVDPSLARCAGAATPASMVVPGPLMFDDEDQEGQDLPHQEQELTAPILPVNDRKRDSLTGHKRKESPPPHKSASSSSSSAAAANAKAPAVDIEQEDATNDENDPVPAAATSVAPAAVAAVSSTSFPMASPVRSSVSSASAAGRVVAAAKSAVQPVLKKARTVAPLASASVGNGAPSTPARSALGLSTGLNLNAGLGLGSTSAAALGGASKPTTTTSTATAARTNSNSGKSSMFAAPTQKRPMSAASATTATATATATTASTRAKQQAWVASSSSKTASSSSSALPSVAALTAAAAAGAALDLNDVAEVSEACDGDDEDMTVEDWTLSPVPRPSNSAGKSVRFGGAETNSVKFISPQPTPVHAPQLQLLQQATPQLLSINGASSSSSSTNLENLRVKNRSAPKTTSLLGGGAKRQAVKPTGWHRY